MLVHLSGVAGPFTVVSVTVSVMVLRGAALQPTYHVDPAALTVDKKVFTPITLTVWGADVDRDGGTRMGGDRIVVCNLSPDAAEPCRGPDGTEKIAGPDSPLVVYGDTSQDGVWYGGEPDSVKGHEFGPEAVRSVLEDPRIGERGRRVVVPAGRPVRLRRSRHHRRQRPVLVDQLHDDGLRPAHRSGFTAYGGEGDDLIIGSQAGDHLAGGSGDDTIVGLRGVDHIYGDGGINVDILTRGLFVEFVNRSPAPTLDPRPLPLPSDPNYALLDPPIKPGNYTLKPAPGANRDFMAAGDDNIFGEGSWTYTVGRVVYAPARRPTAPNWPQAAYDDIVFADHGLIIQQVADTNEPDTRLQKIQTTTLASVRFVESRAYQNGGDDTVNGNQGRDVIVGGAGHDMLDGDEQDDMVFGDNIFLARRVVEALFPPATDYTGATDITSGRFQTLCGSLMYSRTDRPAACGGPVTADNSGLLLVDGTPRNFRDPDSPGIDAFPWWAEYVVRFDPNLADLDEFHSFDVQLSVDDPSNPNAKGLNSFGNDYIAGGAHNDLVFGQMGDDIVMGDGRIEDAASGDFHVGASRSPDGCPGGRAG